MAQCCSMFMLLGSSTVEHSAVNRNVVGSNPTRGANSIGSAFLFPEPPYTLARWKIASDFNLISLASSKGSAS